MSDNTASNLGTGQGIFAQKVGDDLQFKSLVGGTNVTLTADANNITITASNDTTALNLGTGSGLFTSKSGDNLQLKSLIANAASGISVTANTNDLTFQLVSANVDAGKLGGVAASDFLRKSDNLASVTSLATARSNLSVYSKAEIDSFTVKNNANVLPDTDSTYSLGSNSYKWLNIYADYFYGRASVAGAIDSIANIGDVDTSGAVNGSVLKYNSSTTNWEVGTDNSGGGGGGSATFVGLSDTPANFTGDAGKYLRVNSGESAVEFDVLNTTDVAEGTNLYYTDARADARAQLKIDALVDSAPGALDTLNELAAALGDDANFSTTITNSIATKLATADFNTTFDNRLATKSTTNLPEGTNLYFTNARADGRISAAQLSALSNVHTAAPTDGQVLAWDNANSYWAPSSTGAGDITAVVAGTGLTGGATSGSATLNVDVGTSAGKIVQLDGSAKLPAVDGSALTNMPAGYTNSDVDTHLNQSNPTAGYVLSWNGSDYAWVTNAGYTDTDFDNRLATKSTTNLAEGTNLYYTDARVNARVNALGKANWDTAYGWGDHGAAGYLTSVPAQSFASLTGKPTTIAGYGITDLNSLIDGHLNQSNPTAGYVLSWNGSDYAWVANSGGGGGMSDLVDDTTPQLGGTLDANGNTIDMGTNVLTDTNLGQFITAYGWGNHASAGYLTSIAADSITDTMIDFGTGGGQVNTADIPEVTNLYYTNARADARIAAASINALSDVDTSGATSGQLLAYGGTNWSPLTVVSDNIGEGSTNLYYTDTRSYAAFDTRLATKDTGDLAEGSNLYFTNARADTRIAAASINALSDVDTSGVSSGQVLAWNGSSFVPTAAGSGDITRVNITAGTGLTGTQDTTSGDHTQTLNVDVGTTAGKIVQLDGSAKLPAVDGSNLTGISGGATQLTQLTDVPAVGASDDGKILYYDHGNSQFNWKVDDDTPSDTDAVPEGSTNLYYTDARVDSALSTRGLSGGGLTAGSTDDWLFRYSVISGTTKKFIVRPVYQSNGSARGTGGSLFVYSGGSQLIGNSTSPGTDFAQITSAGGTFVSTNSDGSVILKAARRNLSGYSDAAIYHYADKVKFEPIFEAGVSNNNTASNQGDQKGTWLQFAPKIDNDVTHTFGTGAITFKDYPLSFPSSNGSNGQVLTTDGSGNLSWTSKGSTLTALSDVDAVGAAQDGKILYYDHSSTSFKWKTDDDVPTNTDAVAEGSSNLYFTNARVDTHLNQSNPTSGYVLSWNGSDYAWVAQSGGGGTPGGSNTQVQFNDGGSFAGDSGFTYNKTTDELTVGSVTTTGSSPNLSAAGNLGITTTASNGNITITPHNTGDIILDGQKWPQADGSANQYLKTNGAGQLSWDSLTTDDVAEGSNEYFTNARAISAVQGTNLNMGSNNITTTGKILYSNVYSAEGDLPSASTYHGMFAHVHGTGAGYFAHAGNWIKLANNSQLANSSNWDTAYGWGDHSAAGYLTNITGQSLTSLSNVDAVAASDDGKVLYYDHSSTSFKWKTDATGGGTLNTAGNTGTGSVALSSETLTVTGTTGQINVDAAAFALSLSLDPNINSITSIAFEGSTADTNETKLQAVDPTADNTINLPDASGHLPVFATASPAAITDGTNGQALVTNGSGQLSFTTISGGGTDIQRFKINYATNGQLSSITDKTSGISSVSIDSAAGGDITINFTGYNYPPGSVTLYGYNYSANKYNVTPLNKDITLREIPGGGSSGSPTAFGSFSSMKIKASEGDAGASRSFGTVTHTWVHLVMGG